jgi:hypothetical protein
MFRELMKKLGIQTALSTAYHPQTNGTTEHFNQKSKHIFPSTVRDKTLSMFYDSAKIL